MVVPPISHPKMMIFSRKTPWKLLGKPHHFRKPPPDVSKTQKSCWQTIPCELDMIYRKSKYNAMTSESNWPTVVFFFHNTIQYDLICQDGSHCCNYAFFFSSDQLQNINGGHPFVVFGKLQVPEWVAAFRIMFTLQSTSLEGDVAGWKKNGWPRSMTKFGQIFKTDTPPKFNMAPEKSWLEYSFPLGMVYFQGLC